jgi:hypothetical protein
MGDSSRLPCLRLEGEQEVVQRKARGEALC